MAFLGRPSKTASQRGDVHANAAQVCLVTLTAGGVRAGVCLTLKVTGKAIFLAYRGLFLVHFPLLIHQVWPMVHLHCNYLE